MLYPLFLKLEGAPTLVVGAGTIAKHKAEALLSSGACVTMIAPQACADVRGMAAQGRVQLELRPFAPADVDGMRLVIAATSDTAVNEAVMRRCRSVGVLVNVVDDPARCDFYTPSLVQRGRVQVAISTGGASPAFARKLKNEIASVLEPTLGRYAELVAEARERIKTILRDESYGARRLANEAVLESDARRRLADGDEEGARQVVEEVLASLQRRKAGQ